jgi:hypothetical protein
MRPWILALASIWACSGPDDPRPGKGGDDGDDEDSAAPHEDEDEDGDGWLAGEDCDDADPTVHPGALELCDGRQNDCDASWSSDAGLATWFGPAGNPTDQTALLSAGSPAQAAQLTLDKSGTLALCEGTFLAELLLLGEEVTVRGTGEVRLAGDGDGSVLTVGTGGARVTLEDLEVVSGAARYGGGLDTAAAQPVQVTMRRVTMRANVAGPSPDGYGGAAYVYGDLTLEDSVFVDNRAVAGGAVAVDGGTLTASRSTFEGNTAESAGAVLVMAGALQLQDTLLVGNAAPIGGQLYLLQSSGEGAAVSIEDTPIDTELGGGLLMDGSTLTLTDSAIRGHSALVAGGGVYLAGSSLTLIDSHVDDNSSVEFIGLVASLFSGYGGGAYLQDSTLTCSGSGGFDGNNAVWGPAVYAELSSGSGGAVVSEGCDWTSSESSLSTSATTGEVELVIDGLYSVSADFGSDETFRCDEGGCR